MKKTVLGIFAGVALSFALTSCGPKLLTDEQVQAEITKGIEAGKPVIDSTESVKCAEEFETRVTAELERKLAEYETMKESTDQ